MIAVLGGMLILCFLSATSALPLCVCARNLRPVCGSDGRTYSNECRLQCEQLSTPDLTMLSAGPCPGHMADHCICTLDYTPVCGTDGKTYPNQCTLTCEQRTAPVEIAHTGACRQKRDTVQVAEQPGCTCPRNYEPVCGNDGETYDNYCLFECFRAKNANLRLEYPSACGEKPARAYCICTDEYNPVCGSDGNTYGNQCYLKCESQNNNDLKMSYMGECSDKVEVVNPTSCICTREAKPVCGTDGNTYSNPCMLNCAREKDESLHIDHVGPCDNKVKIAEFAENIDCTCTRNLKPVCASNGVTFTNECLMRCAGTNLTVAKDGPCEE